MNKEQNSENPQSQQLNIADVMQKRVCKIKNRVGFFYFIAPNVKYMVSGGLETTDLSNRTKVNEQ